MQSAPAAHSDDLARHPAGIAPDGAGHRRRQRAICAAGARGHWRLGSFRGSHRISGSRGVPGDSREKEYGRTGGGFVRRILGMAALALFWATPRGMAQQTATPPTSTPMAAAAQSAAGGRTLTIEEAEAVALRNNPQITVGKLRALQAHEFVREVRSTLMPQANGDLEGVGADSGTRLSAGGFLTNGAMFSRAAAGVAVSQLITDRS